MSQQTVLVSGAGIAGPTIAYWLLRRGFTPVLIERAPRFREGGYMIDFWGVGFDVAERMGLIPALRRAGYLIDRIKFVAKDGRQRSGLGGNAFQRTLGDRFLSIQRGDLAHAIYHMIENDVEAIFGDSIAAIRQNQDCVKVTFEHGRPRAFDLVIGADGLHSAVRTALFGPLEKFEHYLGYYAASFLTSDYPWRDEHTYMSYAAPGRQISRYALREDRTAFFFVFASQEKLTSPAHDLSTQKQILRQTFGREPWIEWPEIVRRLDACNDLYFDAVSQVTLPCWSQGRAALIGDAAYCPSLLAGEGTAFAMAGAYILVGELDRAGGDYAHAFAAYERSFRPFIERKQKSARAFASSFTPKSRFGLFVRDQVLRLSAIPAVADWLMRRYVADGFLLPD
jgi:2-polyprenyl-6-methoxyphenol hydroxylase-like FAD-dependent oxidoreductase